MVFTCRFPKNESTKQKWLDAINVSKTPNFKTAYICSDHFDAESFFYYDELRQKMRLYKEAVPKQKNSNSLNLPRENEVKMSIYSHFRIKTLKYAEIRYP